MFSYDKCKLLNFILIIHLFTIKISSHIKTKKRLNIFVPFFCFYWKHSDNRRSTIKIYPNLLKPFIEKALQSKNVTSILFFATNSLAYCIILTLYLHHNDTISTARRGINKHHSRYHIIREFILENSNKPYSIQLLIQHETIYLLSNYKFAR